MRKLSIWVLIVVLGLSAAIAIVLGGHHHDWSPGYHRQGTPLRVGYTLEAPYAYLDDSGRVTGEAPEILRVALARLGEPEPVWLHHEFPGLIAALQTGQIDVIAAGMFITPERTRDIAFTRPTALVGTGLLVAAGNPFGLRRLADLAQRPELTLAAIDASVEATQAAELGVTANQLLLLPDALSGVAAVRTGRAAAFALSAPSLRWTLRQLDAKDMEMADPGIDAAPVRPGEPAYAFRRDDPLRDQLDQALAGWLGSAEHRALALRHGFSAADLPAPTGAEPAR